jgi:hypothetical protein
MLPKGWLKDPVDGPVDFIGYARNHAGDKIEMPSALTGYPVNGLEGITTMDSFLVFTACHEAENFPVIDYTINGADSPYVGTQNLDEIYPDRPPSIFDSQLSDDEKKFTLSILTLVFRLLLALEARPQLITYGERLGTHKKNRNLELWTPNIVGATYVTRRYDAPSARGDGTGTVRLHWRMGHYRRQAFGHRPAVGPMQHRTIWIDPVLVGEREEDAQL